MNLIRIKIGAVILTALVSACTPLPIQPFPLSSPLSSLASPLSPTSPTAHLSTENAAETPGHIPEPVRYINFTSPPPLKPKAETYNIVVNNVQVRDLLLSLAHDAKLNADIHPGVVGTVSLNALKQTLPQLLKRMMRQVDMRYELEGQHLSVMPDSPFLRTYKIDYVNMSRDTAGTVTMTTQVATGISIPGSSAPAGGANNTFTRIENGAKNHFWETLIQNIKDILHETDIVLPTGSSETIVEEASSQSTTGTGVAEPPRDKRKRQNNSSNSIASSPSPTIVQNNDTTITRRTTVREATTVIANPETGILSIRATGRQHEKLQEFLDQVMLSARRQVLIEATVAEVQLSDNYQQGVDWSRLRLDGTGFKLIQKATGALTTPASSIFELTYANADSRLGNIASTVRLLESFGAVKVLSSPKLSVLNNQTAILKVVDNIVYFTVKVETTALNQTNNLVTTTTTPNTVPVGFVMNVTPQISEYDTVLMNVRPSVSRIIGSVADPNPELKKQGIVSTIPIIRAREMESMLRIQNGNIAVMGGLMEDVLDNKTDAIPGVSQIPILGNILSNRDNTSRKTELVVFLRPTVIKETQDAYNTEAQHDLETVYLHQGNLQKTTELYTRILDRNPQDALAEAALIGLQGQADPYHAESRLKTLLGEQPAAAFLHFTLGNLLGQQARWAEAHSEYFRAYESEPDNPNYRFNLAVSLDHLKQTKQAAQYYKAALEGNKSHAFFDEQPVRRRIGELTDTSINVQ